MDKRGQTLRCRFTFVFIGLALNKYYFKIGTRLTKMSIKTGLLIYILNLYNNNKVRCLVTFF